MENDGSSAPTAHSAARQHAWNSTVQSDGTAIVTSPPGRDRTEPMSVFKSIRARPLGRTHALWIIVGALWLSLGMIVSATLVTVAFLT